jgi:hypothetical protein
LPECNGILGSYYKNSKEEHKELGISLAKVLWFVNYDKEKKRPQRNTCRKFIPEGLSGKILFRIFLIFSISSLLPGGKYL